MIVTLSKCQAKCQFMEIRVLITDGVQGSSYSKYLGAAAAGDVNQLVSIIIKMFIRYPSLIRLIKLIHKHYPLVTIIFADDRSEVVQMVNSQYTMKEFA